tara:strand:- start:4724 stop:6007 length:1284 start_codon:yes stop_codon:yes gene_type:complete
MTKFALLADIHEQLRMGGDRVKQLARLENADDAIMLYQFFYPTVRGADPIRMLANEAASFYDVVKDMLPEERPWMTLASESADYGSRDYDCGYVRALLNVEESFTEIAKQFNEKEARLLWRWAMHSKPVISKRTFFGALARLHSLPVHILQANMNITMIAKIYNQKDSILGMERWWEYGMHPAPMRWKAWSSLAPPTENHYAVIVPEGEIKYIYRGYTRSRNGLAVSRLSKLLNCDYLYSHDRRHVYTEVVVPEEGGLITILDKVDPKKDNFAEWTYDKRIGESEKLLTTNRNWDDIVYALQSENVRCIRLIPIDGVFEPDAIGGYVMHSDRTKVFLRAEMDVMGRGPTYLQALDGISEYITVGETDTIPNWKYNEHLDHECIVIEVAAVRVSAKGQLLNFTVIGRRDDLGIADVTQFTELVERGMN